MEAKPGHSAVPGGAVLMIEMELVSWKSVETITDDKKVVKKVLKAGEGYQKPNDGTRAQGLLVCCLTSLCGSSSIRVHSLLQDCCCLQSNTQQNLWMELFLRRKDLRMEVFLSLLQMKVYFDRSYECIFKLCVRKTSC